IFGTNCGTDRQLLADDVNGVSINQIYPSALLTHAQCGPVSDETPWAGPKFILSATYLYAENMFRQYGGSIPASGTPKRIYTALQTTYGGPDRRTTGCLKSS